MSSGESTLLQLLLQKLEPNSGTVEPRDQIEVAYFDQLKAQIRGGSHRLLKMSHPNGDTEEINGIKKHISPIFAIFSFFQRLARAPRKAAGWQK